MAKEEGAGGFGWLPEDIIHRIMSFLDTDDKLKVISLSTGWSNAYHTIPNLEFNEYKFRKIVRQKHKKFTYTEREFRSMFRELMDNTLQKRTCGWISSLDLTMDIIIGKVDDVARLDKCLRFALENGIRKLSLTLTVCDPSSHSFDSSGYYVIPNCVLKSKSLTILSLHNCKFPDKLIVKVLCKNIKTLTLSEVRINDDTFSSLIAGCPLIEYLNIRSCTDLRKVELINVPCLKELYIYGQDFVESQAHQNLQILKLEWTDLNETFFDKFMNKFPNLRSLVVNYCSGFARMNLKSNSLWILEFRSNEFEENELEIDAPNLISVVLHPSMDLPELSS